MLVAAYVVSAVLEVVGIGLVVRDVLADRARRKALLRKYTKVYEGPRIRSSINNVGLGSDPKQMAKRLQEHERQLQALEVNSDGPTNSSTACSSTSSRRRGGGGFSGPCSSCSGSWWAGREHLREHLASGVES